MNNNLLKTYLAVLDCGSFSAAATSLGISQPAVTMQIHNLEEELGYHLLDRRYRRITLTEAGQLLKSYAEHALSKEQSILTELAALSGEVSGNLTIACSTTPGNYLIPGLLGGFLRQFPQVRPQLVVSSSQEVARAVDACEADLGVMGAKIKGYRIDYKTCGHDELVPIAPPTSRTEALASLSLSDLRAYPWIQRNTKSGTQMVINEILAAQKLSPDSLNCLIELDNPEAIIGAVEGGLGVAIVSRSAAERALWLGTIVELPVQSRPWKRRFYLARPRMAPTRAADAFAEYLEQHLE
ncbi:MAG: LysR family transcriptional regulator [Actinomycetia bacterium]|nr:LysR family transcriptional regulator [Actinomycetes bacterium]